jgi:hypothetical protein
MDDYELLGRLQQLADPLAHVDFLGSVAHYFQQTVNLSAHTPRFSQNPPGARAI